MTTIKQQLQELHQELARLAPEYDLLTPVQQSDLINMLQSAADALRQEQEDWHNQQLEEAHKEAGISCPPIEEGYRYVGTGVRPWDYTCPICGRHYDKVRIIEAQRTQ